MTPSGRSRPSKKRCSPPKLRGMVAALSCMAASALFAPSRVGKLTMVSPFESDNVHIPELIATAARISRRGFGILAADESVPTAGKRLKTVGVENTAENRRAFRELLFTAEGLEDYISGVILFDETMYQRTAGGERFVDCLSRRGILVGTKLDTGLRLIAGTEGETRTGGLDGLGEHESAG